VGPLVVVAVVVALGACGGGKSSTIAELVKADGPIDRAEIKDDWKPAKPGTTFALGDAARTGDGGAQLKLLDTAQLGLQPNTILRFAGTHDRIRLLFEAGGGKLRGAGEYALSVGSVKLDDRGELQITSSGIKLLAGNATRDVDGAVSNLKLDQEVALDVTVSKVHLVDAGVPDAAPPPDAAEPPPDAGVDAAPDATVEVVSGLHVETLAPGETKWKKLDGKAKLATGTAVRTGDKSRARLVGAGTSVELGANSRAIVKDGYVVSVEIGGGSAEAAGEGKVGVPGGAVALKGSDAGPAQVAIAVEKNGEAKVKVVKPSATLTGGKDASLELGRDESATLSRAGSIHPVDVVPSYFDVAVPAGETSAIHDPRPPTAVKIDFSSKCPGGGVVELDQSGRFRAPRISRGREGANVLIAGGGWAYRVRCGDDNGRVVAQGRLAVVRDDGRRKLPATDPTFRIDDECRSITFDYQSQIPNFDFRTKPGGSSYVLHLASGGEEKTFPASSPAATVPAKQLHEGLYTFFWERDGKQGCVSSLTLGYNNTVAQIYIQSPPNGQPFGSEVVVKGTVLAGFSARVDSNDLPMDSQHRFNATVPPPPGRALAIRLTNPKRGIYYYLCRP
jgi:hypothetical protein